MTILYQIGAISHTVGFEVSIFDFFYGKGAISHCHGNFRALCGDLLFEKEEDQQLFCHYNLLTLRSRDQDAADVVRRLTYGAFLREVGSTMNLYDVARLIIAERESERIFLKNQFSVFISDERNGRTLEVSCFRSDQTMFRWRINARQAIGQHYRKTMWGGRYYNATQEAEAIFVQKIQEH